MEMRVVGPFLALFPSECWTNVPEVFLSAHEPESELWISSWETPSHC